MTGRVICIPGIVTSDSVARITSPVLHSLLTVLPDCPLVPPPTIRSRVDGNSMALGLAFEDHPASGKKVNCRSFVGPNAETMLRKEVVARRFIELVIELREEKPVLRERSTRLSGQSTFRIQFPIFLSARIQKQEIRLENRMRVPHSLTRTDHSFLDAVPAKGCLQPMYCCRLCDTIVQT